MSINRLLDTWVGRLVQDSAARFNAKGGPQLAAALTFFTLFSFAPLLIFVVAAAGMLLGQDTARVELVTQIEEVMGGDIAQLADSVIASTQQARSGTIAVLFGLTTVAYGASRVFRGLQGGLNFMWDARPRQRNVVLGYIVDRVFSWLAAFIAGMSLALALALFVSVTAMSTSLLSRVINVSVLPGGGSVFDVIGWLVALVVVAALFAAIYKLVPAVDITWSDVVPAASIVSAALFVCAKLVGVLLGYAGPGASYVVASVPTVALIWVNVSAQIIYLGAAFTYVFAHRYGSMAHLDDEIAETAAGGHA
ncbi:MAG: YihY/virulence factor BrkB family protein [Anaerolineae bacterium]|jgi:membrane protein